MKLFFLFCFAVFFFAGCGNKDQKATVNGPKEGSKETQQKLQADKNAKEIAQVIQILRESDHIFEQVWPQVVKNGLKIESKNIPHSVFEVVGQRLLSIYDEKGALRNLSEEQKKQHCAIGMPYLKIVPFKEDSKEEIKSPMESKTQASSDPKLSATVANPLTQAGNKPKGLGSTTETSAVKSPSSPSSAPAARRERPSGSKARPTEPQPQGPQNMHYYLGVGSCDPKEKSSGVLLAQWRLDQKGRWNLFFNSKVLSQSPNKGLSQIEYWKESTVQCIAQMDSSSRMQAFKCFNLSQDIDKSRHIVFTNMLYDRERKETPLHLEGVFRNEAAEKASEKEIEIKVKDYAIQNELHMDLTPKPGEAYADSSAAPAAEKPEEKPEENIQPVHDEPGVSANTEKQMSAPANGESAAPAPSQSGSGDANPQQPGEQKVPKAPQPRSEPQDGDNNGDTQQQQQQAASPPPEAVT